MGPAIFARIISTVFDPVTVVINLPLKLPPVNVFEVKLFAARSVFATLMLPTKLLAMIVPPTDKLLFHVNGPVPLRPNLAVESEPNVT